MKDRQQAPYAQDSLHHAYTLHAQDGSRYVYSSARVGMRGMSFGRGGLPQKVSKIV